MNDQEFVILLGDEPGDKAADSQVEGTPAPADDGFVILLNEDAPAAPAGEFIELLGDSPSPNEEASGNDKEFVVLLDGAQHTAEALHIDGLKASLDSELGVAQVAEAYQQLAEWLSETEGELTVNLASCDYLDSAGWQLLALFQQKMEQLGRSLKLEAIGAALYSDYQRYGVGGILPGIEAPAA